MANLGSKANLQFPSYVPHTPDPKLSMKPPASSVATRRLKVWTHTPILQNATTGTHLACKGGATLEQKPLLKP